MNKKLMIGVGVGFATAACLAAVKQRQSGPSPDMWVKMREKMEEMPEDFPPRMMFDNVETTKAITEEILTLLQRNASERDHAAVAAT